MSTGAVPEEARNRAVTAEELRQRLSKTGGTVFTADRIEIELDEGLTIPASAVNGLRRELLEEQELADSIDRFLRTLPERECSIFLRRYWYVDPVQLIAARYEIKENTVKSILFRTREKLRRYLLEEGIAL